MRRWKAMLIFLICTLTILTATFAATSVAGEKRLKTIDFEDELVEGLNKRNLDSLSYLGEREEDRNRKHLYRKRATFRGETKELLREMRYQ